MMKEGVELTRLPQTRTASTEPIPNSVMLYSTFAWGITFHLLLDCLCFCISYPSLHLISQLRLLCPVALSVHLEYEENCPF